MRAAPAPHAQPPRAALPPPAGPALPRRTNPRGPPGRRPTRAALARVGRVGVDDVTRMLGAEFVPAVGQALVVLAPSRAG
ncbi:hypothetical protein [Streptomyces sp. NPDC007988]|uniref:hypothetical protein n=1 Tax=Streptomyces sp. NPDC007988 TaxID=3364802 RepID=UPI0036E2F562